ncbi:FAD-dependent oxidoreductase [Lysobacter sp. M15]|uniref:NAD(P)/FAD-dependent oxidoreductase n=1 Tax=Lysobacter sp. M15 TaxID=2916837 RepID=UPI001F5950A1|nr:FAD-dependent oxidoreductase [Lysobacter sp. M15]
MPATATSFAFDVVVVGASFAGAACAIAAAQRGLRVCVLERKRDPGDKLRTTGIIVKEAAEQTLLNQLPASLTRRIEEVRLYAPSLKQVTLAAPGYYFLTTDTPAAPVPCTAFSASAMHQATSAGWRRIPPACRPDWRCVTTRPTHACPTSMASCCAWAWRVVCRACSSLAPSAPA